VKEMADEQNVTENTEVIDEQTQPELESEEVNNESISESEEVLTDEQKKINELEQKLEETTNRMLRAQADFDNFRRRVTLDREAAEKYRSQSLVNDLLPVVDNLERAMAVEANDDSVNSLIQGMEMVYRQFKDALTKEGVEEIEAQGIEFDPNLHQAVMQVEESDYDSNVVVEVLQKGYKLKDRVIRPAMVKVNQ
jgi:molecular chaperone GrpE